MPKYPSCKGKIWYDYADGNKMHSMQEILATEDNQALLHQLNGHFSRTTNKQNNTTTTTLHPFNGLFSTTTWVSRYQKGKTSLDLNGARNGGVLGWQWHQLDHTQTICTSLQTDNHTNTPSH